MRLNKIRYCNDCHKKVMSFCTLAVTTSIYSHLFTRRRMPMGGGGMLCVPRPEMANTSSKALLSQATIKLCQNASTHGPIRKDPYIRPVGFFKM